MGENNTLVTSGKPRTAELAIDSSSDASSHTGSEHSRPTTSDIQHNLCETEVSTAVTTVNSRVDINLSSAPAYSDLLFTSKTNICQ
jgi:hypothetical protein